MRAAGTPGAAGTPTRPGFPGPTRAGTPTGVVRKGTTPDARSRTDAAGMREAGWTPPERAEQPGTGSPPGNGPTGVVPLYRGAGYR
ncbi:hypothetical protein GCM10018953_06720 [Streptosporangium nondiastaticum]